MSKQREYYAEVQRIAGEMSELVRELDALPHASVPGRADAKVRFWMHETACCVGRLLGAVSSRMEQNKWTITLALGRDAVEELARLLPDATVRKFVRVNDGESTIDIDTTNMDYQTFASIVDQIRPFRLRKGRC